MTSFLIAKWNLNDVYLGIFLGAGLIFMNLFGLFNFALPPVLNVFSKQAALLIIFILAPILEEFLFGSLIPATMGMIIGNFIIVEIVTAFTFALFHLRTYSQTSIESLFSSGNFTQMAVVGGAFLSAIIFSLTVRLIARQRQNLIISIIPHAMINLWLIRGVLVII